MWTSSMMMGGVTMPPLVIGATGAINAATIDCPAGVADGDLLLLFGRNASSRTLSSPGWTSVANTGGFAILSKIASGEPANYATSWGGSGDHVETIVAVRNAKFDVIGPVATGDSTTFSIPSITAAKAGILLAAFTSIRRVSTGPAGMTALKDTGAGGTNDPIVSIWQRDPNEAGPTGSKSMVWNSTSSSSLGALIQLG